MEIPGYQILEEIGQGGMARVYKARQLSLKRDVAVKTLSKQLVDKKGFRDRFNKESLIIARLSNPYIIPVIERGISEENIPYFIMEYIEGKDLKAALESGQLDFNHKLDICIQICKALAYAHQNGVVHRDIKPANILLDAQSNAKVMDFGIAQYYSEDIDGQKTQMGDLMGTISYMSPEQHQSASLVTYKSDLYSLGVMMYRMFTLIEPHGRFKSPREIDHKIPVILDQIIVSCLSQDPDERPESAEIIKNQLLQLLGGAHLQTEQKQRAKSGIKNLELLDILEEDGLTSISLYENKADNSLLIINKRPKNYPGLAESKILSKLSHPNIVNILGTTQSEKFYLLVMEYINSGNLQDRLVRPYDWKEAVAWVRKILDALMFAHNNRVIHGDLRPSNILFTPEGDIKISGFGLRKPDKVGKTRKSRYKIMQESPSVAADIYATGIIFYQLITGEFPNLQSDYYKNHKLIKQLPHKLQQLIQNMIKRSPSERPSSCLQVIQVLEDLVSERRKIEDEQPTQLVFVKKEKSVNHYLVFLLGVIFASAILVIFFYYDQILPFFVEWFEILNDYYQGIFYEKPVKEPEYIEF